MSSLDSVSAGDELAVSPWSGNETHQLTKITRNKTHMAHLQCLYSSASHNHLECTHARFFRNAPRNSANHPRVSSGTRPKIPRDTHAFLQERDQKFRETLTRFFRNATKNSARHPRVSSGTRPKIPWDTHAFLQERDQKERATLERFFRNATKKSWRPSRVSSGTRPKIPRNTRAYLPTTRPKIQAYLRRKIFQKIIYLK